MDTLHNGGTVGGRRHGVAGQRTPEAPTVPTAPGTLPALRLAVRYLVTGHQADALSGRKPSLMFRLVVLLARQLLLERSSRRGVPGSFALR